MIGSDLDVLPPGLRLNEIQFMATHNSCHQLMPPDERFPLLMGSNLDSYRYEHPPLDVQLGEQRVRGVELDLYPDPDGGRYRYPSARRWRRRGPRTESLWNEPGFKVMHGPDADYGTSCPTLSGALRTIRGWSQAHPWHVPIVIQLELKASWPWALLTGGARVPRWSPEILDDLDEDIRRVFDESALLTPDRIRGAATTLEEAVSTTGWPFVDDVRGTVLFFLDYGDHEYVREHYRRGRPSLQGRAAFTAPAAGHRDSAFVMCNDPRGSNTDKITELVRRGYFVRTRSDEPVSTAKTDEHTRPAIAMASGAQMISTDFPQPGLAFRWGDGSFVAQLPTGAAVRPNPVTAPSGHCPIRSRMA
ncbi:calcium-dependent phosphoinositide phospholipase C [Williamsia limnetica]|uniref:Calcium-dependent phosphoinositide phospholipase C n=1 Tax=Williamsia limnetica TaxID=882452 RepID=A0A318RP37_WILLI|nr:Ca2+-dependent phosphoinositide-specific phospholipase C [Williamsia limnetica]PYE19361.1 calcium-dependent phosphoinositide phospholipase C [Williamsia limnetica]